MSLTTATATATDELVAAVRTVPEVRVWQGLRQKIAPPAVIVGPPRELTWEGYCGSGAGRGLWPVYVAVALSEYAPAQLLELVEPVAAAIEEHTDYVVTRATSGVYPAADNVDHPAYQIEVWCDL